MNDLAAITQNMKSYVDLTDFPAIYSRIILSARIPTGPREERIIPSSTLPMAGSR